MPESRIPQNLLAAVVVSVSLVVCCWMLAGAVVRIKSTNEMIRVTGSARKPIRSDFIIWRGHISLRCKNVTQGYQDLKTDMDKAKRYLNASGVVDSEITTSAIEMTTLYAKTKHIPNTPPVDESDTFRPIEGYSLSEDIEVRSSKVDVVGDISRKATELISQGVPIESQAPQYIYTKLSDMKVTMLAEAAKDARSRADQIANNSGCHVGSVRFARMGVLQITPIYSTEFSSGGAYDTTSLDKEITAIVTMGFSIR